MSLPGPRVPKCQDLDIGGKGCTFRQFSPADLDIIARGDFRELSLVVSRAIATLADRCESSRYYRQEITEQGEWI